DQQTPILFDIEKSKLIKRINSRLVLILLAGIDPGSSRVTGPNIKDQIRTECVGPGAPVISTLAAAGSRALASNRVENGDVLLCVAEKDTVVIAEAMIDSDLKA